MLRAAIVTVQPGFDQQHGRDFLFLTELSPPLSFAKPPVYWLLGIISGVKLEEYKANH
jgi:hypothetical protein